MKKYQSLAISTKSLQLSKSEKTQNLCVKILSCCTLLVLFPSCGDQSKKDTVQTTEVRQEYVGSWICNGMHPLGNRYGKYTIQLDLAQDGSCKMKAQNDSNKSAMSDEMSDIILLEGKWNGKENNIEVDLKVTNWIVTMEDYRKEESFDDFVTRYTFKFDNGRLIPRDKYSSRNVNIGTTEEARDVKNAMYKGKVIILVNAAFDKK